MIRARLTRSWVLALLLMGVCAGQASAAVPANDAFADATVLTGSSPTFAGSNLGATAEPGEPNHDDLAFSDSCTDPSTPSADCMTSVWYQWTPTTSGTVEIADCQPATTLDSEIAVYTGSAVGALTQLDAGAGDCESNYNADDILVEVTANTTYHIVVTGRLRRHGCVRRHRQVHDA